MLRKRDFSAVNRLVVKVGSSSLIYPSTGRPNLSQMEQLVRQLADLHNAGRQVILVTSGAIGMGVNRLGIKKPRTIPLKQAAAAVGQGLLMHLYEKMFAEYGVTVGQVLLTRADFADRRRFLNARHTLSALLRLGVIPIINENDTVAVDEIKWGDNDNLAAQVAGLVDADLLILLSDIEGLYTSDPRQDQEAQLISEVIELTPELEAAASGAGTGLGSGGMITKLQAAQVAMHCGITMVLARASEADVIRRILAGEEIGTVFWPVGRLQSKKRWLAYSAPVQGKVVIDDGAVQALKAGKSLLPSGVLAVEGHFEPGNIVSIVSEKGEEIGRGMVNFSHQEVDLIKGKQTREIFSLLGRRDYDEVVHADNLVLESEFGKISG